MILYLDPFSGASGDMFLGLLVDLGVEPGQIEAQLRCLPLNGWRLAWQREKRCGIEGCRALVAVDEEHHHRSWRDIDQMLATSSLAAPVCELARRIFHRLAEAEGKVHGVAVAEVHFHEVGALDSVIDIVGVAAGLVALHAERIVCGALPFATGIVQSAHGRYPLPAPATLELLRGWPQRPDDSDSELITPTGAAIIAEVASFGAFPAMTLEQVGYGVGSRDSNDRPNLLRGCLGRVASTDGRDKVTVIETHLDDSSPELLGYLSERLFAAGALDVGYSPLQMKKNRPGTRLTVVSRPAEQKQLARLILRESSAIGVRFSECERLKLRREAGVVMTDCGDAVVKLIFDGEELLRVTPEFESCRTLAEATKRPLAEIYRLVEQAADEKYLKPPSQ
ncbi:MAG: TIGR00299 family protein [Deltaproteobacteria bacterium HGW-Deltaproteobacteria-4]|nr:MAG: TIGR00299 family protein [Deltaproteobacteria bacterium HGW-Deltaproteobacteria-4]